MNDFRILLQNDDIQCNHMCASLISNKIFRQIQKFPALHFIDFSNYNFAENIKNFFDILKGNKIEIMKSSLDQNYDAISFLEFSSVSIHPFFQSSSLSFVDKDILQLSSLPPDSIENILSSHFLHLESENQLFKLIQHLIQENSGYLNVLRYIYLGFVDHFALINLIDSIQFEKIEDSLFEHLKCSFAFNFYLPPEKVINNTNDPQFFSLSGNIQKYFEEDKINQEVKLMRMNKSFHSVSWFLIDENGENKQLNEKEFLFS
jgi:hypothetical protein